MSLLQTLKKLVEKTGKTLELRPGMNATSLGKVHLGIRVHRAKEDRWFDVGEIEGPLK